MGLFEKFTTIANGRNMLDQLGFDPFNVEIEEILSPTMARIAGGYA